LDPEILIFVEDKLLPFGNGSLVLKCFAQMDIEDMKMMVFFVATR